MTVLYIIIFILLLSILVIVHEAGHFMMAKAFNVYCFDFSIGFGPTLFRHKRKGGETYFSLRCIPLGGYVSMYGEDDEEKPKEEETNKEETSSATKALDASLHSGEEMSTTLFLPEEKKKRETWKEKREHLKKEEEAVYASLDPSRSIMTKNRGKQAIVYVAGIVMNMLLALILFFVYETFFPQKALAPNMVTIEQNSIAEKAGFNDEDVIDVYGIISLKIDKDDYTYYVFDMEANLAYEDGSNSLASEEVVYAGILLPSAIAVDALSYDDYFVCFYVTEEEENGEKVYYTQNVFDRREEQPISSVTFIANTYPENEVVRDEDGIPVTMPTLTQKTLTVKTINDAQGFESLGMSMAITEYSQTFGDAIVGTFVDFGDSCTTVGRAIGRIFSGSGLDGLSGVIGIYGQTTTVLTEYGFGFFLYTWGLISVNLALLNLIPIPGLDGWQLLVCGVEAATRRKIPRRFKTIMSIIGYILIIGLFVIILFQDIIALI